jgi:triosephosphate isomerase (TIM)
MSRRQLIAGNWKMNLGRDDAVNLAAAVASAADGADCDVALFPPFPWLIPVKDAVGNAQVMIGAQNCHWEEKGAFTGEVAAPMLRDICRLVLAGHSERRHVFGETDEQVGMKVAAILRSGIDPVLCVGETIDERNAAAAGDVVTRHLGTGLAQVADDQIHRLTIAYEPVWAIGTGVAATPDDAQEMCALIRAWMAQRYGAVGREVRVLYGGSMTADNAAELLGREDVDGGLVGGASLSAASFATIIASAKAGA